MRRNKFNKLRKIEKLEDRQMMAVDMDLNNGILTIEGTNNDDYISISYNEDDADEVLVTIRDDVAGNVLDVEDFDLDEIQEIKVYCGDGNDEVRSYVDIRTQLYGENGDDYLRSGGGDDLLEGGDDDDYLFGDEGNDDLKGGSGNDGYFFTNLSGSDVVYENANQDSDSLDISGFLFGSVQLDLSLTTQQVVNPTHVTLQLSTSTGIENVSTGAFSTAENVVRGNSRNNEFRGSAGRDTFYGGDGNDTLRGMSGRDYLYGEAGDDDLYGDGIFSGGDRDYLDGGIGNDDLYGGVGNDELFGGDGADILYGQAGDDYLYGQAGDDDLYGGDNLDLIYGGTGNDDLFGEKGDDYLYGETGVDNLDGGDDNDFLDGGIGRALGQIGRDQLRGGGGSDIFVRNRSTRNRYTIFEDLLDFSSAVDEVMTILY